MTLEENISRIATAKENIKRSIQNKGIEVEDGALLDTYASKIDLIETGSGDDWILDDLSYLFYNCASIEQADNILKHCSTTPTSLNHFAYLTASKLYDNHYKIIDFLKCVDFSQCSDVTYSFNEIVLPKINDDVMEIYLNLNLSYQKNLTYFLNSFNRSYMQIAPAWNDKIQKTKFIVEIDGTTNNVTNFSYCFRCSTDVTGTVEILNFDMSKCSNCTGTLDSQEGLTKLTFKGSFGGLSTSKTLTLDLSSCTLLTVDAFLETMTSISENTNGKTRIFKLPAALYESLTDEIYDLADEKGYTLASA